MKRISYALLITAVAIGSVANAIQQPPQPTTATPNSLPDKSVCPDVLNMPQLNELKGGKLKLSSHPFKLHSSPTEFHEMLPANWQIISKSKSEAHITEGALGRSVISTPEGHIVKCTYTFRTALGSKTAQKPKTFAITSAPDSKPLPQGLAEALSQ